MGKAPKRCGYVAIVGRPNVGKSTLLNAILGQKLAITSQKPQTTRHSIVGIKSENITQVLYVDTPGIHLRGEQVMNRYLNRTAKTALSGVDLIVWVVEALRWTDEDKQVQSLLKKSKTPVVVVVNKIDKVNDKEALLPFLSKIGERCDFLEIIPLSAKRSDGVERLEQIVTPILPEGEHHYSEDQISDRSARFFAAEFVREQLTRRYSEEIPYALTVDIEQFEEKKGLYRIGALVWVESEGQKKILIGKKGEALKAAARDARLEMERFFNTKVYLQVWVKVKKSWSSDEAALSRLGYND